MGEKPLVFAESGVRAGQIAFAEDFAIAFFRGRTGDGFLAEKDWMMEEISCCQQ
jgi:hypothetical protein